MNVKTNSRIFWVLSFFGFSVLPFAAAAAIGVSPAQLEFNLERGETASQKIFLQNLDENPTKVSLILENMGYEKQISINPDELILPGKRIEEVEIKVEPKKKFETEIQIQELARTEGELTVASGVRIPVSIKVENSLSGWALPLALLLAAIATAAIYFVRRKRGDGSLKTSATQAQMM